VYAAEPEPELFPELTDAEYWKSELEGVQEYIKSKGLNKPNSELSPEQLADKLAAQKELKEAIANTKEYSNAPNSNNASVKREGDPLEEGSIKRSK
jgi:hypothetical protein